MGTARRYRQLDVDAANYAILSTIDDLMEWGVENCLGDGGPDPLGIHQVDMKDLGPFRFVSPLGQDPAPPLLGLRVRIGSPGKRLADCGDGDIVGHGGARLLTDHGERCNLEAV